MQNPLRQLNASLQTTRQRFNNRRHAISDTQLSHHFIDPSIQRRPMQTIQCGLATNVLEHR